jgi:glutamate racemase
LSTSSSSPIGLFDSGIGGFSVLREIRRRRPGAEFIYLADHAHMPYGARSLEEVRAYTFAVVDLLRQHSIKLLVVACNTASAAALYSLRTRHPDLPIVGMEPAVKPAVAESASGVIGVLATEGTLSGEPFAGVVERFAAGATVLPQVCSGLVEMIERFLAGEAGVEDEMRVALTEWITPLINAGADRLVLGCTHYPLIRPMIEEVAGTGVRVVDPSDAVAAQVDRCLEQAGGSGAPNGAGRGTVLTTGNGCNALKKQMVAVGLGDAQVSSVHWDKGVLVSTR